MFHGQSSPQPSQTTPTNGTDINPNNLQLRTNPATNQIYIQGVSEFYVSQESDVFYHLQRGNAVRAVGETKMNRDSSRSHSVFIIKVERREGEDNIKTGQLYLVDLAGSESVGKTGADGLRLKEVSEDGESIVKHSKKLQASAFRRRLKRIPRLSLILCIIIYLTLLLLPRVGHPHRFQSQSTTGSAHKQKFVLLGKCYKRTQ